MNRQQKEELVSSLRETLTDSNAAFLVRYQGLTVGQMQSLRGKLRVAQGGLRVSKVRLLRRALDGLDGADGLDSFLRDQIGVAFAFDEAPAVAKVLQDFSKENESLQVLAGLMDAAVLDAFAVGRIANLPSREVLLAQVCGGISAPMNSLVNVLYMSYARIVFVLRQAAERNS